MDNSLLDALYASDNELLNTYLELTSTNTIKDDMKALIHGQSGADLKAFTMAAMQGLAANPEYMTMCKNTNSHFNSFVAASAIALAQSTLAELSKHQ